MEAVCKNSINSTVTASQVSNLSTARLLIDHIKRLVEDDMKSTVEAFESIESEVDIELKSTVSTFPNKKFDANRISRSRSSTSHPPRPPQTTHKRYSMQPNYRVPSAAFAKRSSEKSSVLGTPVPGIHLESDSTMEENYYSYDYPHLQLHPEDLEEPESMPSSPLHKSVDKQNSVQSNNRVPSAIYSKRASARSLVSKTILDSYLASNTTRGQDSNSCDFTHSQLAQLNPENFEETESRPEATSTPAKGSFSFPTVHENESVPSESTITNRYNYQNDYQCDNSKFKTIEAMYRDLKADLNRIFQRFAQESNETSPPTATNNDNAYQDASCSLFCDQTSQTSFGTSSHRYMPTTNRYGVGMVLPQLLAFGDNCNNNRADYKGKGFTIISEPYSQPNGDIANDRTNKMNETPIAQSIWSDGFDSAAKENGMVNPLDNNGNKITEEVHEPSNKKRNSIMTSQKPTDSEGEIIETVDFNVLPEIGINNYVTLTDIDESSPDTIRSESKITNNISTSLLVTPKTMKSSTNDCNNLEEIALLISRASPSKRVILKKKVPEVSVKGYNRNCNEKLIFSGDKVTHLKTDRKVICRKYDPK